jgi:hypothetical protein
MAIDQILTGSSASNPLLSARATTRQVCAAGAGNWSEPSTLAVGTMNLNANTVARVPMKMPQNCAMNWRLGCAPSRYPLLRSVSRSADERPRSR